MKRTKIAQGDPDGKRYAIGDAPGAYSQGPFISFAEVLVQQGVEGEFIWRLVEDSPSKRIRWWDKEGGRWAPMEDYSYPEDGKENSSDEVSNDVDRAFFERGLQIDRNDLDGAFIEQPDLLRQVSDRYAMALSLRDAAKDAVKQVEAQLYVDIRRKYERTDKRITENQIKAEVDCHPDRKAAVARYVQSVEQATRWEGVFESYRARGFALGELNKLFIGGFLSSNSAKGGADKAEYRQADQKLKDAYRNRKGKGE